MYEDENKEEPGTFAIFFAEGESLAKQGEYHKAIESFSKALEFQPGERGCLVARSKCYLQLGNASSALQDAEESLKEDKKYHRGLYHKAEALYQMGDFEYALVYYHRGYKLRPELGEFKLGIQKAQEAIQNSIGTPEQCQLELVGDLTHFTKQAEMAKKKKQVKKAIVRPIGQQSVVQQKPKERKPVASDRTVKELLGELFADKQYLEGLLSDKNLSVGRTDDALMQKIHSELEYLDGRVEFWRQEKPMYARKREKELKKIKPEPTRPIGMSLRASTGAPSHSRYVLKCLEEIDHCLTRGEAERSLEQGKSLLRTIQNLSEGDLPNKAHFVATVHSCIGSASLEIGDAETSLEHHLKDYAINKELESEEGLTRALDNLVRVYVVMGEFQEALDHLNDRLPYVKQTEEAVWVHHEMGRCYLELGEFDKARENGEKAMNLASEVKDMPWYLNASIVVAQAEVKSEDWKSALQSYERSLEIAKIVHDNIAEEAITKALKEVNEKIVEELKSKETGDTVVDTNKDDGNREESQVEADSLADEDSKDTEDQHLQEEGETEADS